MYGQTIVIHWPAVSKLQGRVRASDKSLDYRVGKASIGAMFNFEGLDRQSLRTEMSESGVELTPWPTHQSFAHLKSPARISSRKVVSAIA